MNFSLILFVLVVFTGLFYLVDVLFFRPERKRSSAKAVLAANQSGTLTNKELRKIRQETLRPPLWLEYTGSFFPVILFVFVLRSFVVEPFKIPSGSMIPTLLIGDLILVNKYAYGIRLPVINKKIIEVSDPEKGDVMVFRYPVDPTLDYIKRVVAVGGDTVEYRNKQLIINGEVQNLTPLDKYYDPNTFEYSRQFEETLAGRKHRILNDEDAPDYVIGHTNFPGSENCKYSISGFKCVVPKNHYFMMGDNRDNSSDSRVWGFVSNEQIVGKAFMVWMNFDDFGRIGKFY